MTISTVPDITQHQTNALTFAKPHCRTPIMYRLAAVRNNDQAFRHQTTFQNHSISTVEQ